MRPLLKPVAHFPQGGAHRPWQSGPCGSADVQKQQRIAADRSIINFHKMAQGFERGALQRVVEPAEPDGNVHLGGIPHKVIIVCQKRARTEVGQHGVLAALLEFAHIFILLAVRREVLLVVSKARHDVPSLSRVLPLSLPIQRTSGAQPDITMFGCNSTAVFQMRSKSYFCLG